MIIKNRKLYAGVAGVILLAAAMLWLAFNRGPLAPVQVELAAVTESRLTDSVFGIGSVEARYAYAIGPTQAGRVLKVLVDHGDSVKAGQVLAEIDPIDLQQRLAGAGSALQRARDSMLVAEAQEREVQSRHDLARANAARYRDLAQKNFISREAVEIRDNEARVTVAALEASRAALRVAQQDLERAGHDRSAVVQQLANLRLIAPVDGLVTARAAEPGNTVVAGQAVVLVIDPKNVWVRARIDQSRAAGLASGLSADIVLRSNPANTLSGKVARVEIQGDTVTEERVVAIAFDAPPQLSLGELAEVTIHRGKRERGMVIPSAAVKRVGEQQGVWQVVDGKTRFRAVKIGAQTLDGMSEILSGLGVGDTVIVYSSSRLIEDVKVRIGENLVINLASRDIAHGFGRYLLTSLGLGLLIGVTLSMAGIYRGMVEDAKVLLHSSGADIWVVQQHTLGPFAESSSLHDDVYRGVLGLPGVAATGNVTFLTMQVRRGDDDVRVMIAGFEPGRPGEPTLLVAGRPLTRSRYEAIADIMTGFKAGDTIRIRRNDFTIVGLTRRMVSTSGDPMVFITLKDAQEAQFLKDNEAIHNDRNRLAANPALNRPGVPGLLKAVEANQFSNHNVNAVLVQVRPGWDPRVVADNIKRWKHLQAYTIDDMEEILVAKLIATAARQIAVFLVILALVSAAIVALIIYTMTLAKIKEIAVLKLIGTKNSTIAGMILQEALGLGLIGFLMGKLVATLWAPYFPKYVLLLNTDAVFGFTATMVICALASVLAIRAALRVDPAEAIGG